MKKINAFLSYFTAFSVLLAFTTLIGCDLIDGDEEVVKFAYPNEIYYKRADNQAQVVAPTEGLKGEYFAIPDGLDIDPETGEINVQTSETGIRYYVFFRSADGAQQGNTEVVIGGIDYLDQTYKFSALTDLQKRIAPIFNADVEQTTPPQFFQGIEDNIQRGNLPIDVVQGSPGLLDLKAFTTDFLKNVGRDEVTVQVEFTVEGVRRVSEVTVEVYYGPTLNDIYAAFPRLPDELKLKQQYPRRKDGFDIEGPRPPLVIVYDK